MTLVEGDVLDRPLLDAAHARAATGSSTSQANADVRHGLEHPRRDLEQNTIATANVLEAMRAQRVSSGSPSPRPARCTASRRSSRRPRTPRFPSRPRCTRASKLAGEGLIGAYATGYGFTGLIFRFVSILGERYTHGHVFDFYRALKRDPTRLRVLGDGRQEKSYLYVQDCVEAILTAAAEHEERPGELSVYNLGTDETVVVDDSIGDHRRAPGARARDRVHRRDARMGRRQPADPPRLRADPRARLGARR